MRRGRRSAIAVITAWLLAACVGTPVSRPDATATASPSAAPTDRPVTTPTPVPTPTLVPQPADKPPVSFARADFARGTAVGVTGTGPITLAASALTGGSYDDPFGARGIAFQSGSWTSEWTPVAFAFDGLVASWNAETPAGTWIKVEMQARGAGRETKFFTMITWASGDGDIHRTSTSGQQDGDGDVNIDTFVRAKGAAPVDAYRLRVTLYQKQTTTASPSVRMLAAMTSAAFKYEIPSLFSGPPVQLQVPPFSQETHAGEFPEYDGGGEAWCSPTSTSMVVAFHGAGPTPDQLEAFPGDKYDDPQVDYAARYTYDWNYKGAGNWPANVAYATRFGLDGFVTRLRSLSEAQRFLNASIPLVASINGALPGFLLGTTNGHLLVIRGFDANGDVITNDPAVKTDEEARKVYRRADFERVWLGGSAGIVYVIYPRGRPLPPNVAGLPPNW
ncbi:MAG: peptidase C39 family protein [Chloroflexi bacterium]|nr:MAG: peptidase C39 family protein [Chloroflexota bacterium]